MDEKSLKEAIQVYFNATNESDANEMATVFHDSAHLYQIGTDGALSDWDKDFFMNIIASGKQEDQGKVFPTYNEILSIDFTSENTAVARVKVRVRDILFTDILSFICLDNRWWIIAKVAAGVPV